MRSRTSRGKDRKCEGVVEAMLGDGKAESVGFIRGRLGIGLQNKYWGGMQGGRTASHTEM